MFGGKDKKKKVLEKWAEELGVPVEEVERIHQLLRRKVRKNAEVQRK